MVLSQQAHITRVYVMSSSTATVYHENIQFSFTADRGNWTEEGCRVEKMDNETGLITS